MNVFKGNKIFKKGDRVKRRGYNHDGYTVIGYNGAGAVLVLSYGEEDRFDNRDVFPENWLTFKEGKGK